MCRAQRSIEPFDQVSAELSGLVENLLGVFDSDPTAKPAGSAGSSNRG